MVSDLFVKEGAPLACSVIGDVIKRNAHLYGDKVALVASDGATTTFAEFAARVRCLGGGLARLGLTKGERVAILARNRPEYLEAACVSTEGFVAVPLNWRLSARELKTVLDDCRPCVLITDSSFVEVVSGFQVDYLKHIVSFDNPPPGWLSYQRLLDDAPANGDCVPVQAADTACLVYTSGTTGSPKGAELTHRGLLLNCEASIVHLLRLTSADNTLACMPLFHVGGLWYHLFPSFAAGCTTFVAAEFEPRAVLAMIARNRITNLHVVPTMLHALLEQLDFGPADYPSLRLVFYAASSISPSLLKRAIDAFPGCGFVQGYGSTEAGMVTYLSEEDHRIAAGSSDFEHLLLSCGRALPGIEVGLADVVNNDDGGVIGEICVRSELTMAGYWRNREATARAISPEGLRTGDLGRRDHRGYYFIIDRKSDMIVTGGENVYPREVEDALLINPAIAQAAVFDVPDAKWVQRVVAAVVLRPECHASAAQIIAHVKQHLAPYKCPKEVFVVDELPMNAAGKVLRKHLRATFSPGASRQ